MGSIPIHHPIMIKEFQSENRFLSNFWFCNGVTLDGKNYPSVEHAYQAAKTLDDKQREAIRTAKTPGEAKKLGKSVTIRPDWEDVKIDVMYGLLKQKFSESNPLLLKKLKDTGNQVLQEGNYWYDTFWGVDLRTGKGQNNLGKLLMKVRDSYENNAQK